MFSELTVQVILAVLILSPYLFITGYAAFGWLIKRKIQFHLEPSKVLVTVVVAMRNEEHNISYLIHDLANQYCSQISYEVILSDDSSEDNTLKIAFESISQYQNFRLLKSDAILATGKKAALERAIHLATGNIIITTDADCRVGTLWLNSMVEHFIDSRVGMVIGPVMVSHSNCNFFESFQLLEFASMVGSSAGLAMAGAPILCNGANLAFRKNLWENIKDLRSGKNLASGDDVFLLHAIKRHTDFKILFAKNRDAIVTTQPAVGINGFMKQRSRWAGKSLAYKDFLTIFTGFAVAIANFSIILTIILWLGGQIPLWVLGFQWGLKTIFDLAILIPTLRFFNKVGALWHLPFSAIIYPGYIFIGVVWAFFIPNGWKGRKI